MLQRLFLATFVFTLSACGGDSSSSGTTPPPPPPPGPQPPFGIDARPAFSGIAIPVNSGQAVNLQTVDAFPNLTFDAPLFMTGVPGEDRVVVVEQSGRVRVLDNDAGAVDADAVLDLSGVVTFSGEQGLLGLAFDPDFTQNRFIYVHYSIGNPRRSVIARFTWDAGMDQADLGTEKMILEQDQPFSNHNGGMLAFGPDDYLYIAFGDGGSGGDPQNNAQNGLNWLGSLLRIDVHPGNPNDAYDVPADNPFVADPNVLDETFALGLRNPFRFSFDRSTGTIWLGDVGQGAREEIDIITAGGNYGWRVYEGDLPFDANGNTLPDSAFTFPVLDYDRAQGVSVIGGYVYRGARLGSLYGTYLYTDFGSGTLWGLVYDGNAVVSNTVLTTVNSPTSLGEDNDGEVYVVSQNGSVFGLEEGVGGSPVPTLLSQTGIFDDLSDLTAAEGFIEYDIRHPFWSDGAAKRRWFALPGSSQIVFDTTDPWTFPEGTVLVKHFEIALDELAPAATTVRLETRALVRGASSWAGYTYRWNTDQTDADLVSGRDTMQLSVTQTDGNVVTFDYELPSGADCQTCHNDASGFALGLNTRQVNMDFVYPDAVDNQLRTFDHIELFTADIGDAGQYDSFTEQSARVYLDVNCASCHLPGGPTPSLIDLRFDTPVEQMQSVGVTPTNGDLGLSDSLIISPGDRSASVLWLRMQVLDENRMPPVSSHRVDDVGLELVGAWIDALE